MHNALSLEDELIHHYMIIGDCFGLPPFLVLEQYNKLKDCYDLREIHHRTGCADTYRSGLEVVDFFMQHWLDQKRAEYEIRQKEQTGIYRKESRQSWRTMFSMQDETRPTRL